MTKLENIENESKLQQLWERYDTDCDDKDEILAQIKKDEPRWCAIDTETTGLNIGIGGDSAFLIIIGWISKDRKTKKTFTLKTNRATWSILKVLFETVKIVWAFNAKFDINILRNTIPSKYSLYIEKYYKKFFDVQALWRLTHNVEESTTNLSLKNLASVDIDNSATQFRDEVKQILTQQTNAHKKAFSEFYFKKTNKKITLLEINDIAKYDIFTDQKDTIIWEEFIKLNPAPNYKTVYDQDCELMLRYAHADVIYTLELAMKYWPELIIRDQLKVLLLECAIIIPIANQERTGIPLDINYLKESKERVKEYYTYLANELKTTVEKIMDNPWHNINDEATYNNLVDIFVKKKRTLKGVTSYIPKQIAQNKVDTFKLRILDKQINTQSTDQLNIFMYLALGQKATSWDKNQFNSTYESICQTLASKRLEKSVKDQLELVKKFIDLLRTYRRVSKWANTYIGRFLQEILTSADNRLHPTFHAYKTITGRFSSPLQQEPRDKLYDIRTNEPIFDPRAMVKKDDNPDIIGVLAADLSQIEIRVNTEYTFIAGQADTGFVDALLNGVDTHKRLAAMAFHPDEYKIDINKAEELVTKNERTLAKNLGFGMLYGGGKSMIEKHPELSKLAPKVQANLLEQFDKLHQGTRNYQKWAMESVTKNRLQTPTKTLCYVENLYGRRYYADLNWVVGDDFNRGNSYRFINYLIQGTCAYALKNSIVAIDNYLTENKTKSRIITNIHDEIQVEIYKGEEYVIDEVKRLMEDMPWATNIPIICDLEMFTTTWNNKIDYDVWKEQNNDKTKTTR